MNGPGEEESEFAVTREQRGEASIVAVCGDVDLATAPVLRQHLEVAVGSGGPVAVDLSATDFMDSSGIRELIWTHRTLRDRGRRLVLTCLPEGSVQTVLRLSGMTGLIETYPSIDAALQALDAAAPDA